MRIRSQLEIQNDRELKRAERIARERKEKPVEALGEAAYLAGETIARLNNNKTTKVDDVIKAIKPKYLEDRA